MNSIALILGCVIAALIIVRFRITQAEQKPLPYPLLLASFSVYYFVFAIYANDYSALGNEALVSVLFVLIAIYAYKKRNSIGLLVLAIGYIGHAVYDFAHDSLFVNHGSPLWWPEFCGAVDGIIDVPVGSGVAA